MSEPWVKVLLIVVVVLLIGAAVFGAMQCPGCQQEWMHVRAYTTGLDRRVTLYGFDGKIIRQWTFKGNIEDQGGSFRFLNHDGKIVQLMGVVVVEQE